MNKVCVRIFLLTMFVLVISGAVIYFTVDINTIANLHMFQPWSVLLAILAIGVGLVLDGTRLMHMVKISGEKITLKQSVQVVFGNYFLAMLGPGAAAGAIAQVITNKSGGAISVTAQATGASGENMRLVQAGDVDFAMVQNDVADSAFNGLAPFRSKLDNVRVIGRLYPEYLHVVASKDSGVKALEDFKGKKVSVGARGSGNEVNCRQIFGFYGLDYKNIEPIFLPYGETADQFKDRQVDGFVFTIGTPNPAIQDITTSCPWPARRSRRSSKSSPTW